MNSKHLLLALDLLLAAHMPPPRLPSIDHQGKEHRETREKAKESRPRATPSSCRNVYIFHSSPFDHKKNDLDLHSTSILLSLSPPLLLLLYKTPLTHKKSNIFPLKTKP